MIPELRDLSYEVGRMSPVGRFLVLAAFCGVLLSTANTVDAERVRCGIVF